MTGAVIVTQVVVGTVVGSGTGVVTVSGTGIVTGVATGTGTGAVAGTKAAATSLVLLSCSKSLTSRRPSWIVAEA